MAFQQGHGIVAVSPRYAMRIIRKFSVLWELPPARVQVIIPYSAQIGFFDLHHLQRLFFTASCSHGQVLLHEFWTSNGHSRHACTASGLIIQEQMHHA